MSLPTYQNLDLGSPRLRLLLEAVAVAADGSLALAPVHGGAEPLAAGLVGALAGAASIGVAPSGDVYLADTDGNRVLRIPGCGGDGEPVGCLGGMLRGPRGVLVGPRDALYVADSGNDRVVVVDLVTEQLLAVWGQHDRYGPPVAGSAAGELSDPWDLAADAAQRVYVVDHGNRRIQRFDAGGRVDAAFATALAHAATAPDAPEQIASTLIDGEERLLVIDRVTAHRCRLLVYDVDAVFREHETRRLHVLLSEHAAELLASPGPIATAGGVLHVAEAATGRILSFDLSGQFLGAARWTGGVSALELDAQGRLLVQPASGSLVRLQPAQTAAAGTFRIGPVTVEHAPIGGPAWQELRARLDPLPDGAHVRLFALAADDPAADPPPLDDPAWSAAPVDADAWRLTTGAAEHLWVGGRLTSGTAGGPVVRGLRVDFDREGWIRHLPAIYARESDAFLEPALALLEQALGDEEALIESLPRLFDPAATPTEALTWLAGWLAWPVESSLDEQAQRATIARAFDLQGMRGTAEYLRELIALVLGADAQVLEPATGLRVWQLGEDAGRLGWGTMLAAAEPDGAVLGTTAELDHSHLDREEDFGAPVFDATAHRFCVRVYGADLVAAGARATLERLVERERPAETEAHLCVIDARMRVGFQATVGIDAIVGREAEPLRLGEEGLLGAGAALADAPERLTVGDATRLGRGRALIQRGAR